MRKIQVKDIWFVFVVPLWKFAVAIFSSRQRGPAKYIAVCSADFLFSHVTVRVRNSNSTRPTSLGPTTTPK